MTALKIEQFGGMLPAWDDRLLPNGQSAASRDGYLFSGALQGWRQPKLLHTLTNSAARFAYRLPTVTKATAGAYLIFNAQPLDGDTVKIGEEVYTFKLVSPLIHAFDVLIGADVNASALNLLNALTLNNGAATDRGVLYGPDTVVNTAVSQKLDDNFLPGTNELRVLAPDFGESYNTTPVAESTGMVRMIWVSSITGPGLPVTTHFTGGVNATFDSTITGSSIWLEFLDPDTTVMRSPVVDDKFERYYFASPSIPPQYNTRDRINAGLSPWYLGVPAPGCDPRVSVEGGGDTAQLGKIAGNVGTPVQLEPNFAYLIPITPDGAEQLDSLSFVPFQDDFVTNFAGILYADDGTGTQPGALLNVGSIQPVGTGGTATDSVFLNPTGLLANQKYWIGIMIDAGTTGIAADILSDQVSFSTTFTNGPPDPAPTVLTGLDTMQMWGNLTTSSVVEPRAYVYTWVTEYGEEGPPSPPTLVNGWSNGTWTVGVCSPTTDEMGVTRNIKTVNIYRTISSVGGTATYFFVATIPVTQESYVDIITDDIVALNVELPSTTWFPPPVSLIDITSMPNGMAVGFRGNELWFCEPYRPHAWPAGYVITTEFPIVGLGISGQSVVVATTGKPYVASGVTPSNMTISKLDLPEPCISKDSVVTGPEGGVFYMSPNGLIQVTETAQASNSTAGWITRERWRALTPQKNTRAIILASSYFCFGTRIGNDSDVAKQGFTIAMEGDQSSFTIWPQPGGHRVGFGTMSSPNDLIIDNVLQDPWTGIGMLVQNGGVYYYDFQDQAPTMVPYRWRSKVFQQNSKRNFEAVKIYFEVPPGSPALGDRNEAATDDPSWNTLGANQYLILRVYVDNVLRTTREVQSSGELLRILSGFKGEMWQFELEGRVFVSNMQIATTAKELSNV